MSVDELTQEEAKAFGRRLQALRERKGLSQAQLARVIGVPIPTLKNWEQGRRLPLINAAVWLASGLDAAYADILDGVFGPPRSTPPPPPKKRGRPRNPTPTSTSPTPAPQSSDAARGGRGRGRRKQP